MNGLEGLGRMEVDLGNRFQRQCRKLRERFVQDCKAEFLAFFEARGFSVLDPGTAYGANELSVWDGRRYAALEIEDGPESLWSGPPRLRIRMITRGISRENAVEAVREFPRPRALRESAHSKKQSLERLRDLIKSLPASKCSFRLFRGKSEPAGRGFERFAGFGDLLESLMHDLVLPPNACVDCHG